MSNSTTTTKATKTTKTTKIVKLTDGAGSFQKALETMAEIQGLQEKAHKSDNPAYAEAVKAAFFQMNEEGKSLGDLPLGDLRILKVDLLAKFEAIRTAEVEVQTPALADIVIAEVRNPAFRLVEDGETPESIAQAEAEDEKQGIIETIEDVIATASETPSEMAALEPVLDKALGTMWIKGTPRNLKAYCSWLTLPTLRTLKDDALMAIACSKGKGTPEAIPATTTTSKTPEAKAKTDAARKARAEKVKAEKAKTITPFQAIVLGACPVLTNEPAGLTCQQIASVLMADVFETSGALSSLVEKGALVSQRATGKGKKSAYSMTIRGSDLLTGFGQK